MACNVLNVQKFWDDTLFVWVITVNFLKNALIKGKWEKCMLTILLFKRSSLRKNTIDLTQLLLGLGLENT